MVDRVTTNYRCLGCGQIISSMQYHPEECCESFKAGMKEVVEWIRKMDNPFRDTSFQQSVGWDTCKMTILKKWGVDVK